MADTKHTHAGAAPIGPVEGDGVSYRGIVWFVGILIATTVICELLIVWVMHFEDGRVKGIDTPRAPFAAAPNAQPPAPNLISLETGTMPLGEHTNLQNFRTSEEQILTTYGWIDKNNDVVRIPIDRAKELVLKPGVLPVRAGK